MTLNPTDVLIGSLITAVLGLAGGCFTAWCFRRAENERLERLEDQVETLRRQREKYPC